MTPFPRKIAVLALAGIWAISVPFQAAAWGKKGHGIVAEIAFSMLDTNTKQFVYKYLNGMSIEDAATWMDDVRSDHSYDYMKTWHYVNIEKGKEYEANKDANIINALHNAIDELSHKSNLSTEEIRKDVLVIFHLVGDFHMPLHVGYGIDKGGNDVKVKYLGRPSNLHRVWDTDIIESEKISTDDCLALFKKYSKKEVAHLQEIDIENWISEPRPLLDRVYNFNQSTMEIDQAYIDRNKAAIEQQLLVAGIRLAAVLKKVAG